LKIADIKVIETIKEGMTVFRRDAAAKKVGAISKLRRIGCLFPARKPRAWSRRRDPCSRSRGLNPCNGEVRRRRYG
jgi:hypothetical protein